MCALAGGRIEGDLLQTWTATSLFERLWYLPNIQMTGLRVNLKHECAHTTLPTSPLSFSPIFPMYLSFPAPLPLPLRGRKVSYADRLLKPGQKGANCERHIYFAKPKFVHVNRRVEHSFPHRFALSVPFTNIVPRSKVSRTDSNRIHCGLVTFLHCFAFFSSCVEASMLKSLALRNMSNSAHKKLQ